MPLYGFKCSHCNRSWESYRNPVDVYNDYCCGIQARLEEGLEPKAMALETYDNGPALQLHVFKKNT